MNPILDRPALFVRQRKELAELFGYETRNKYELRDEHGATLGFCAEQQKGLFGFFLRQMLGHWRRFDVQFFDAQRQPLWRATHPFRWLFQRFEVEDAAGRRIGALQQRFAFFSRLFDIEDAGGRVVLRMESSFFQFWTFPVFRDGREAARIEKKWSGLLTEVFTDADNFRVGFGAELSEDERALVLAGAVFVDLQYFERKAGNDR